MGAWRKNKTDSSKINGGQEYTRNDNPSLEQLNAITNNSFYAVEKAEEALTKANSAFENNGTVVRVANSAVTSLNFDSDPQLQINAKANNSDINFDAIDFAEEERQKSKNLLNPKGIGEIVFSSINTNFSVIEPYLYAYVSSGSTYNGIWFESTNTPNQFLIKAGVGAHKARFKNLKPETTYTFSFVVDDASTMIFMGIPLQTSHIGTRQYVRFTTNSSGAYIINDGFRSSLSGSIGYVYASNLQLEEGSSPTDYVKSYGLIVHSYSEPITLGETKTLQNDTVIEYWVSSDGNTWYRKWASGWKECGGQITVINSGETTIALPITFINNSYVNLVSTNDYNSNNLWSFTCRTGQITTSTMKVHTQLANNGGQWNQTCKVQYYCCGY